MRSIAIAMLVVLLHAPAFAAPEHLFMLSGQRREAVDPAGPRLKPAAVKKAAARVK